MNQIELLIVDDHPLVRDGLRALLDGTENIRVVGEASDGKEAIESAKKLQPDVVLLDISMPGMNGIDATKELVQTVPDCKVLILSLSLIHI